MGDYKMAQLIIVDDCLGYQTRYSIISHALSVGWTGSLHRCVKRSDMTYGNENTISNSTRVMSYNTEFDRMYETNYGVQISSDTITNDTYEYISLKCTRMEEVD